LIRVLRALGYFGFFGAPALFCLGANIRPDGNAAGYLCVGWLLLMLLYLAAVRVFALLTKIRPTEITERSISLTNVSEDFADAMDEEEEADEADAWDQPPEKRRPRRRTDDRYRGGEGRPPRRSTDS
jgi:hypothetical protein